MEDLVHMHCPRCYPHDEDKPDDAIALCGTASYDAEATMEDFYRRGCVVCGDLVETGCGKHEQ